MLKSKAFWLGVVAGLLVCAFVPQANVRTFLARPKG